jgi:hypothetical protein
MLKQLAWRTTKLLSKRGAYSKSQPDRRLSKLHIKQLSYLEDRLEA